MPRSRLVAQCLGELRSLLRRVVVDLVEHQHDRLVAGGQLGQRGIFDLVQIRVGDEQDQVGPGWPRRAAICGRVAARRLR